MKRRRATSSYPLAAVWSMACRSDEVTRSARPRRSQAVSNRGRDPVPDDVRERRLGAARDVRRLAVGAEDDGLVLGAAEHLAAADLVDDQQVAALAGQLGPGLVQHASRARRRSRRRSPTTTLPGAGPVVGDLGEDVGVLHEPSDGAEPSSAFLILVSLTRRRAGSRRPRRPSRRRRRSRRAASTASRSSAVVSTGTTLTPAGSGSATLAATRVTSAPRAAAARASA